MTNKRKFILSFIVVMVIVLASFFIIKQKQLAILPASAEIKPILIATLKENLKFDWNTLQGRPFKFPSTFNPERALQVVNPMIYAFPGNIYQTIQLKMTNKNISFSRNSKERDQAQKQGNFLFDIRVKAQLIKSKSPDEEICQLSNYRCDVYYFNLSYSPEKDSYDLTDKEMILQAIPEEVISKALKIADLNEAQRGKTIGWLKKNGGNFWYWGAKDGLVYIYTIETDVSGPELAITNQHIWYIDVFQGKVLKKK